METFKLSEHSSSYEVKLDEKRGVLSIGCKHYRVESIKKHFKAILSKETHRSSIFKSNEKNQIVHGLHTITFEDAKKILNALGVE